MASIVRRTWSAGGGASAPPGQGRAAGKPPEPEKVKPLYPKRDTTVWLLGEPEATVIHFDQSKNNSYGCLGDGCDHCEREIPPQEMLYLPVLFDQAEAQVEPDAKHRRTEPKPPVRPKPLWYPAVLKLDPEKVRGKDLYRGLVYALDVRRFGRSNRFTMRYKWLSEPTVPHFSALDVMANVWYPHKFPTAVYLGPTLNGPTPPILDKPPQKAAEPANPYDGQPTEELVAFVGQLEASGLMPAVRVAVLAELDRRGYQRVKPTPGEKRKPRAGIISSVQFVPVEERKEGAA